MGMPASISAWMTMGGRTCWRRTRIPILRTARTSPSRRKSTACRTRNCSSGSSPLDCAGSRSGPDSGERANLRTLETQFHAKLHLARFLRAEDATEVRRAEDAARHVEVRFVEQVEHFPPHFELAAAANSPRLRQREVGGAEARSDHAIARRAAEGVRGRQRKRCCIEPALRGSLA